MKISFKIKEILDVNIPENFKHIQTGFDNIIRKLKQYPSLAFTNMFLLTAWKVSKYGVISGPNTGKYGPEITPYLDTFYAVTAFLQS